MKTARFVVTGKVQGVWFRASTREQAMRLHLQGLARNLPDGSVEVIAQGEEAALALLESWLWHGPPAAEVAKVQRHELPMMALPAGFSTS